MTISDRAIPKETPETGVAFRAGVKGLPFNEFSGPQPELHVQPGAETGPNERHMETIERLPGLSDPLAAYEAGLALRMIGYMFDQQGSPVTGCERVRAADRQRSVVFRIARGAAAVRCRRCGVRVPRHLHAGGRTARCVSMPRQRS